MKDLKNVANMSNIELKRLRAKLYVLHVEMGWKADKAALRLKKRLKREAKKHNSLEPIRKLLREALIIKEALLPLGDTEALTLVEQQIASYEATIKDVTLRYRLLSEEEIALKEMEVVLLREKATVVKAHLHSVVQALDALKKTLVVTKPVAKEQNTTSWSSELATSEQVIQTPEEIRTSNARLFRWTFLRSLFDKALSYLPILEKVHSWR